MYPDIYDIQRLQPKVGSTAQPGALLLQVALCHQFLMKAKHVCHNHGRHGWYPALDIKALCERFTGSLSDEAFAIALLLCSKRRPNQDTIDVKKLSKLELHFPPLEFDAAMWEDIRRGVVEEVEQELSSRR